MSKLSNFQRGDVVLTGTTGARATVLRVYTLSWCTGPTARSCTLLTVRTTGALASEFTVDASEVRSLNVQTVRYSRLGWTRTWKPSWEREREDDDDYSDLQPGQVDTLLARLRAAGHDRLAEVTAEGLQNGG